MPPVALFQALPKPSKMDIIVRQAAEGGIAEIAPFVSAYSPANARASGSGIDLKIARWGRIIKEARQQSGSAVSTVIRRPCSFQDLIRYWESRKSPGAAGILLHQTFLSSGGFHEYLAAPPDLVVLAIGPEGGFSPSEAGALLAAGFKPALLGAAALRVETAALYAAAAVRLILLERESWMWKNS
jgi:16S rRNA (uracil1498-N3)-methyltransferase